MKIMRLVFVLVCCLAIPLIAGAADQDNNQTNKKKEKQTTQGQQQGPRTGKQGAAVATHRGANTALQTSSSSQLKGQAQHHRLNTQNSEVPTMQSNLKGKVETKHHDANTASQL